MDDTRTRELGWKAVSTASGIVGSVAARKVLQAVWPTVTRSEHEPPLNPADRRIDWPVALQWAIAAGVGAGVSRLLSQRLAAAGWEAATGSEPPGLDT